MLLPRARFLVLAACAACGDGEPGPPRGPDVLVVTVDTLRADKLGSYGYLRDTSPTLDALAAESLLFERCLAPVSQTLPSHATLFTGLHPYEHGLLANLREQRAYVRAPGATSIAEVLAAEGYDTAAFVAAEPVKRLGGLAPGFGTWWEPEEKVVGADTVVSRAVDWLGERPDRAAPFFLWVHLFDVHLPYAPPAPYATMYAAEHDADPGAQAAWLAERRAAPRSRKYETPRAHDLYDGEVRFVDDQLARLFEALRARGAWDETLVVVTSDHGEELMQHGVNGHGRLWDVSLHVPLIVKAPGLPSGREARPLGLADVLPTAFGLAPDLKELAEPWLEGTFGRDVLATEEVIPVLGQLPVEGRRDPGHALFDGRWRLLVRGDVATLYDLEEDPHELDDVAGEYPEVVERLRADLDARLERLRVRGAELGAGEVRMIDPERQKGLEELGYGGGAEDEER